MASFNVNFEGLEEQFGMLDNFDEIAPKIISASVPILKKNVIQELESHRLSGEMIESVKETRTKKGKNGWYSVVRPTGTDKNGVRNMEKLAYLEYGTSKQVATPTLSTAVSKSSKPIAEIMQEVYNKEVSK